MHQPERDTQWDGPQPPLAFTVPEGSGVLRLDAALALVWPGSGLRARRRLWTWCRICVNGRSGRPGHTVAPGDVIQIDPQSGNEAAGEHGSAFRAAVPGRRDGEAFSTDSGVAAPEPPGNDDSVQVLPPFTLCALSVDYAALYKPAGLHSAHIAGGAGQSLEQMLPAVWPLLLAEFKRKHNPEDSARRQEPGEPPLLLTRLDKDTSGLVLAALNGLAAERFREWERAGRVEKTYFAVARGRVAGPLWLRKRLLTANRSLTRVLEDEDVDAARHTRAEALGPVFLPAPWPEGSEGTLLRVRIGRGARHQIRAHLAYAGYPLAGERQYAPPPPALCPLYLHHAKMEFPGFSAEALPDWGPELLAHLS